MKRNKKILKFKKIRIANMHLIKGKGDEGHEASIIAVCQTDEPNTACEGRYEATTPGNPCSDDCGFTFQGNEICAMIGIRIE